MDYAESQAKRREYHQKWQAKQKAERDRQATPEALAAARTAALHAAEDAAQTELARYATGLLNRRLIVPAPVPFISWMA